MVSGTHGNTLLIEQGAYVGRMGAFQNKTEYRGLVTGVANNADTTELRGQFIGACQKGIFMCSEGNTIEAVQVIHCCRQANGTGNIRGDRKSTRLNSSHVKISYA